MLAKVVSAMEEEMDKADTNSKIISMTEKLKDLIIVVGKPQEEREMGIVQTPKLLTRDAFNRGDPNGEEESAAQPSIVSIKDFDSLGDNTVEPKDPKPLESLSLPVGYETPTPKRDNQNYPQGHTGQSPDIPIEDLDPELIPAEEPLNDWETGIDPLTNLDF